MESGLTLNLILAIQGAIVIFGIIIYAQLRKNIRLYQEKSLDVQINHLNRLSSGLNSSLQDYQKKMNQSLDKVDNQLTELVKIQEKYFKEQKQHYDDLVSHQKEEFGNFTNEIAVNFEVYKNNTINLNEHFGEIISKISKSIENYDKIVPILENNYSSLEKISDKSKEIIGDHLKGIKDQNARFDEIITGLKEKTKDSIMELKSETEQDITTELKNARSVITEMVEKANKITDEISNKTKKEIEQVAAVGVKTLKESIDDSTVINLDKNIRNLITRMEKSLTTLTGSISAIDEKMTNELESIESQLSEKKSKRRLF